MIPLKRLFGEEVAGTPRANASKLARTLLTFGDPLTLDKSTTFAETWANRAIKDGPEKLSIGQCDFDAFALPRARFGICRLKLYTEISETFDIPACLVQGGLLRNSATLKG